MSGWISVGEKLPEPDVGVLLYREYGDGSYDYWLGFWSRLAGGFVRHVDAKPIAPSHWKELEPPK